MLEIGKVINSVPGSILLQLKDMNIYEQNKSKINYSGYLAVECDMSTFILASIQSVSPVRSANSIEINWTVSCCPIGTFSCSDKGIFFRQGGVRLPLPDDPVYLPDNDIINAIFGNNGDFSFQIGRLANNDEITYCVDGNKFFGKHIAVVGSTGSGKSCAVAKILQNIMNISNGRNKNAGTVKNSHVIIFDIHSEYKAAFELAENERFNINCLDAERLLLPYWLMNSQELAGIFLEGNTATAYNQMSIFKRAVILSKEKHNAGLKNINFDTPVYFDINEVYRYITNKNNEVINQNALLPSLPKRDDGTVIENADDIYLNELVSFYPTNTSQNTKAVKGAFNGGLGTLISRLETKLTDRRLKFIISPEKENGEQLKTADFEMILEQFLGYANKSNITIIDLSAIPFDVLSIVISLLARLIFDFAFHYSKLRHESGLSNDIPFMLVCEEAHNYIPKNTDAEYNASRMSIERIAKEGRKYGLSLMVVSQRPSEVSETIFSQCNNFLVLKLTNVNDQNCIKNLLPDNSAAIVNMLPALSSGECMAVGEAVPLPAIVKMDMPNPAPSSGNVNVYNEWNKDWTDVTFENVIDRWRKKD